MVSRSIVSSRPGAFLAFALTLVCLAPLVHSRVFGGGNDASRFAQIESLVDYGESSIDSSRYGWTVDRVTIDGKDYSNKPPLLSLFGAAVYFVVKTTLGLDFSANERVVVYLLTLFVIAVPTACLSAVFWTSLGVYERVDTPARFLTTCAVAAGTILTSFTTTFSNHPVAALLLFLACRSAWEGRGLAAGVWTALTACVDLVPGLVFVPAVLFIVRRQGQRADLGRALLALVAGAILFLSANLAIVGSPLPPKMVPGAVDHSSVFEYGDDALQLNVPISLRPASPGHLFAALLGWHGFFSVSPVLLFGAFGMVAAARGGGPLEIPVSRALGVATLATAAGHLLFIRSFGGWSYGYRYLIPLVPLLLFFAPRVLTRRSKWLFGAALVVSIPLALLGAYHPWPPIDEPETPTPGLAGVVSPVLANLSAWAEERPLLDSVSEQLGRRFIGPDLRVRTRYYYFFHLSRGDSAGALDPYRRALTRNPQSAGLYFDLARIHEESGELEAAIASFSAALELQPSFEDARPSLAKAHYGLARARLASGLPGEALAHFEAARALEPSWSVPWTAAARVLAIHPDEAIRHPTEAVRLATEGVALSSREDSFALDTLAAAHAVSGDFEAAQRIAGEALEIAQRAQQDPVVRGIRQRLQLYREGRPYLGHVVSREDAGAGVEPVSAGDQG